ncbi:hypothetical protein [Inhella proteolytica]|uniref:hypothetical protein n=1 Tax=Inhella proteolytica TaxID=2795029 RepID=UPI0018DD181D|nr:hypothetical protein [Inhella proteolytica]
MTFWFLLGQAKRNSAAGTKAEGFGEAKPRRALTNRNRRQEVQQEALHFNPTTAPSPHPTPNAPNGSVGNTAALCSTKGSGEMRGNSSLCHATALMVMKPRIRKPLHSLTPDDFDAFPRWTYADDEEGEPGQDECTVRPLGQTEHPSPLQQVHVQAVFFFPNGRVRLGMLTLHAGDDVAGHQPSLYAAGEWVNFYWGAREPAGPALKESSKRLRAVAKDPYPVRYVSSLCEADGRPLAYGELHGFYWLVDWRTGELRVLA